MIVGGTFIVDQTLGRGVKIEINFDIPSQAQPEMTITHPNGTESEIDLGSSSPCLYTFPYTLEVINVTLNSILALL